MIACVYYKFKIGNKVNISSNLKDNGTNPLIEADFGIIRGLTIDRLYRFIASGLSCVQYNGT